MEEVLEKIESKDIQTVMEVLLNTLQVSKSESKNQINKKSQVIDSFTDLLLKLLELHFLKTKKNKLEVINLIDKLNMRKEYFEVLRGEMTREEIDKASAHLRKKMQSSVGAEKVD